MPFEKDKMKKKDEEILEEMQKQIDEAAAEEAETAEEAVEEAVEEAAAEEAHEPAEAELALAAKVTETEERLKRLQADFENFRRRTRQEKDELANMVTQDIIKDLLPMIDNFERAIAAEATDTASFQQGIEMIYKQLMEILAGKGMEVINTADAKFDPNFHQAVMRVQNPELEDDTIAMELQKGYMVKGKVVRPSMVQVVSN